VLAGRAQTALGMSVVVGMPSKIKPKNSFSEFVFGVIF